MDIEVLKDTYKSAVRRDGKALLLAVMRAKCSEGISFNDENCRGVVIVGISYPANHAPEIKMKQEFNSWINKQALVEM